MIWSLPPRGACSELDTPGIRCCDVERGSVSDRRRGPCQARRLVCWAVASAGMWVLVRMHFGNAVLRGLDFHPQKPVSSHTRCVSHISGRRVPTSVHTPEPTWHTARPRPTRPSLRARPLSLAPHRPPFPHPSCASCPNFEACERHPSSPRVLLLKDSTSLCLDPRA